MKFHLISFTDIIALLEGYPCYLSYVGFVFSSQIWTLYCGSDWNYVNGNFGSRLQGKFSVVHFCVLRYQHIRQPAVLLVKWMYEVILSSISSCKRGFDRWRWCSNWLYVVRKYKMVSGNLKEKAKQRITKVEMMHSGCSAVTSVGMEMSFSQLNLVTCLNFKTSTF